MNFLVLGCNGMAGHTISLYLKERGHKVFGADRRSSGIVDSCMLDATDPDAIRDCVLKGDYDTVINCIGILNSAADTNKSDAIALNSFLPHYLAKVTKDTPIQVIQMSTDCVFSGKKGGYSESDLPDGETFYDRTKALGELNDDKNLTLRNSIVGPDLNPEGIGLLNWFLKQKGNINGYTKSIWTGLPTLQLAKVMEYAAMHRCHGLVNAVPDGAVSKFELLGLFNRYFRNSAHTIVPVEGVALNKSLIRTNYQTMDYPIPDYETMVRELAEWTRDHKQLYPYYSLDV